jgi:hypothetical protein
MLRRLLAASALAMVLLLSACSSGSVRHQSQSSSTASSSTSSVESTSTTSSSAAVVGGSNGTSPTTTITSPEIPVTTLPAGVYTDGSPSVPHYVVTVFNSEAGEVSGALAIAYQDGRHSTLFTFTAHPTAGVFAVSTSPPTYHPEAIMQGGELILPRCQQYLQYALTAAQCTFAPVGRS